ncbi:MAG: NAD(+)/NADH kinase [Lachnospira sp.]
MKHFYVIANKTKDPYGKESQKIKNYLNERGVDCLTHFDSDFDSDIRDGDYSYTDAKSIPKDTECIIVLGGDGTVLQAVRDLNHCNIPFLGVNIGTLGYLTDADMNTVWSALDNLISDDYETDTRMMLDGCIYRDGRVVYENMALNDVVINRSGVLRIIDFDIYVNGTYINSYSADGIIVSTATGSTAYSLSAGGPIVQPTARMIMITPVCPHTLNSRSIIFDADDEIMIQMVDNKKLYQERVATFDGESFFQVVTGDRIVVKKSDKTARFIRTSNISFLERIRTKM